MSQNLVITILDVSGSMDEAACNSSDPEVSKLSRLDLAKHGLKLCIDALPVGTYISIITFSTNAKALVDMIQLTDANKISIRESINNIRTEGSTKIMNALMLAKDISHKAKLALNINSINVIALTDGEDDDINSYRIVNSCIESLKINGEVPFRLDTIGFGPNAKTDILLRMSQAANDGIYSFCFDATMVGTIFVHSIVRSYLPSNEIFNIHDTLVETSEYYMERDKYHYFREKVSQILVNNQTINLVLLNRIISDITTEIKLYLDSSNQLSFWNNLIKVLYDDLCGQITIAISSSDFWIKWGKTYWSSLGNALNKQVRLNFKDKCIEHFGSILALSEYDHVDEIYNNMEGIIGTRGRNYYSQYTSSASVQHIVSTASINDRCGGCFHPNSTMLLENGQQITFDELVELMRLNRSVSIQTNNKLVQIEAIIKTECHNSLIDFCKIGDCILTPNHPILLDGKWQHPKNISNVFKESVPFVFNLVLAINDNIGKRDTSVLINGQTCITLAHGIEDDIIATDTFWGSEKVIDNIKQLKSGVYETGLIIFNNLKLVRDVETGWTTAILD